MDGRQAHKHTKNTDEYKTTPVVLFTTSSSELDKAFAQKWGADFISKPLKYDEIKQLAHYFVGRSREEVWKQA